MNEWDEFSHHHFVSYDHHIEKPTLGATTYNHNTNNFQHNSWYYLLTWTRRSHWTQGSGSCGGLWSGTSSCGQGVGRPWCKGHCCPSRPWWGDHEPRISGQEKEKI